MKIQNEHSAIVFEMDKDEIELLKTNMVTDFNAVTKNYITNINLTVRPEYVNCKNLKRYEDVLIELLKKFNELYEE